MGTCQVQTLCNYSYLLTNTTGMRVSKRDYSFSLLNVEANREVISFNLKILWILVNTSRIEIPVCKTEY